MTAKSLSFLTEGPIDAAFIARSIQQHQTKKQIGAHSIFLGQVRADVINSQPVTGIYYTCYPELAATSMQQLRETIFERYPISCLHIYHSTGWVPAGEVCLFVFASAPHRRAAIEACEETVEQVKQLLPIWGKEETGSGYYEWKNNVPV